MKGNLSLSDIILIIDKLKLYFYDMFGKETNYCDKEENN